MRALPPVLLVALLGSVGTSAGPLTFDHRCAEGEHLTVALAGDVIAHRALLRAARDEGDGAKLSALLDGLASQLADADIAYVNLEGPVAPGVNRFGADIAKLSPRKKRRRPWLARDLGGFPRFNYPPSVARALRSAGVDVISTANNHSLDRGGLGVERTLESVHAAGLQTAGTRAAGDDANSFVALVQARGFTVAFVACTFWQNGKKDPRDRVRSCRGREGRRTLAAIAVLDAREDIDAVIVTPHWGRENETRPDREQRRFAWRAVQAGALVVAGAHPHVLQRAARVRRTTDRRDALISYSLGNLISDQRSARHRTGVVLTLDLVRVAGRTFVDEARFTPTWLVRERRRAPRAVVLDIAAAPWEARRALRRLPRQAVVGAGERRAMCAPSVTEEFASR